MSVDEASAVPKPLRARDAVELATAWVAERARNEGIRVLIIKGPIAHLQGLRSNRISADVDVLVEPGAVEGLLESLTRANWRERFAPAIPWLLEMHSTTMFHDRWPIDLNIHHYWPGFTTDRGETFEELWLRRVSVDMAGVPVFAPDVYSSSLILALHSLRRPAAERRIDELPALVDSIGRLVENRSSAGENTDREVPFEELSCINELASRYGATRTAAPFLQMLGIDVASGPLADEFSSLWQLNANSKGHTRAWLLAIDRAPVSKKLQMLFRAAIPTPTELRGLHPELPTGRWGLVVGWTRRLSNGLKELPRALREVAGFKWH